MAEAVHHLTEDYSLLDEPDQDNEEQRAAEERQLILNQVGLLFAEKRSQAIEYRQALGIEELWLEDEEMYAGIDENNAGEVNRALWRKRAIENPSEQRQRSTKSTIFVNISRPYSDAASARVADMLLPTDDRAFSFKPTPNPDLVALLGGQIPQHLDDQLRTELGAETAEYQAARAEVLEAAKQMEARALFTAERAQKQVDDWLTEGHFHAEAREVIDDSMRYGTGVLKGPIPMETKRFAWTRAKGLQVQKSIKPRSLRVDRWNCYPGAGCGTDIQAADCHFERDQISPRELLNLIGKDGYIDHAIRAVLAEGPMQAIALWDREAERMELAGLSKPGAGHSGYELWYAYGILTRRQLQALEIEAGGLDATADEDSPRTHYNVLLEMVNNHVIKAVVNVLDSGSFPYDYMVYQRLEGTPYGQGVVRHIRAAQRMLLAAVRNMMDNAGLSGGRMWWAHPGYLRPLDGEWSVGPRKGFLAMPDAPLTDLHRAIGFVDLPSAQTDLEKIIMLALRFAEESTGLPMILQGQQGDATKTLGGMQILNNNGSTVLRRIAKLFDDLITEPHMERYYEWLLLHGTDDTAKGDFVIDARGSTALVEREIQSQSIGELFALSENPKLGIDPRKVAEAWVKSRRLSYTDLEYDDEEWKKVVEALIQSAQQGDVRLAVEQLRQEFQTAENQKDRDLKVALATLDQEREEHHRQMTEALEALNIDDRNVDREHDKEKVRMMLRGALARDALKLGVQRELATGRQSPAPQVATPPTEPAGRARDGMAFQQ